ncbi:tRNA 2-thiouridine(34) synthase MnmA [Candidatus Dojkabacteria bacterium]|nr:tRNA 2-thiouridine(34) synthase MnmA [Candidatus Dojkabacteria bacterium]
MSKIYVALSGGVDSAVAALLLNQQGHDITGVFMKNWSGEDFGINNQCPWEKEQKDAQKVCDFLQIPFKTFNFEKEYRKDVIEYFFTEYENGNTPNPDVMCNNKVKFGYFLDKAIENGAEYIATGHYAQKRENPDGSLDLIRAADPNKDQTYFLNRINQTQLSKAIFPIGHLTKPEVRKIALETKLPVAEKKDSQGICFIGKVELPEFLQQRIKPKKGDIIDIDSEEKVGEHDGCWWYTNGQREGLRIGGSDKPYYVAGKDISKNIVFAAKGKDNPKLWVNEILLKKGSTTWINQTPHEEMQLTAMIRYRQTPSKCKYFDNRVIFDSKQWTPAPGQMVTLINNDIVLGGGIIEQTK